MSLMITRKYGTGIAIDTSDGVIFVCVDRLKGRAGGVRFFIDGPPECRIMRIEKLRSKDEIEEKNRNE